VDGHRMKIITGLLVVVIGLLCLVEYNVEKLRVESRQAISDVALINSTMLSNSNASLRCALSALGQVETDIAERDSMTAAEKKLLRERLRVLKKSRNALLDSVMKEK